MTVFFNLEQVFQHREDGATEDGNDQADDDRQQNVDQQNAVQAVEAGLFAVRQRDLVHRNALDAVRKNHQDHQDPADSEPAEQAENCDCSAEEYRQR